MPSEIGASRPLPSVLPSRAVQNAAELSLKLAQSIGDLLPPGTSAHAEVLAVKQAAVSFQLLLRLTLGSGQQTLVTAESPQALPQGSTLNIAAVNGTSLAATLLSSAGQLTLEEQTPLTSLDLEELPVGSLVQGKVLSSTPQGGTAAQPASYRVLLNLIGGPLAGRMLDIDSSRPLRTGTLLSAQVQDSRALLFLPLAGRLDRLELNNQLGLQQARQASPESLVGSLQTLLKGGSDLPQPLRTAVEQLLAGLPDARQLSDPKGLAQALQQSGGFLEAHLLQGNAPPANDYKANLLRLISQLMPEVSDGAGGADASPGLLANFANGAAANLARSLPAFVRNALGTLSQNGSPKLQNVDFPLPNRLLKPLTEEEGEDLETLLKLASSALARLQTHQLSSLMQSESLPDGRQVNTWQMEVPMRHGEGVLPLQVRIQQEESRGEREQEQARESIWRLDLSFDLDPLGPLQVQAMLAPLGLSSQLWAERENTVRLIDRELGHLRERLQNAGFTVRELCCHRGKPPQGMRTALEQRWVDEKA